MFLVHLTVAATGLMYYRPSRFCYRPTV